MTQPEPCHAKTACKPREVSSRSLLTLAFLLLAALLGSALLLLYWTSSASASLGTVPVVLDALGKATAWTGMMLQGSFGWLVRHVLPWVALAACGWFYFCEVRRTVRRHGHLRSWQILGPVAFLALLFIGSHGLVKDETSQSPPMPEKAENTEKILIMASNETDTDIEKRKEAIRLIK